MDTPPPARSSGFVGALCALGDGLLASVQDRLELVTIELQEEKLRLVQTMIGIGVTMLLGALALTFASLLLVGIYWETARIPVLVGLAVFYVVATVTAGIGLRRLLNRLPRPFEASADELKQDRECLRPKR